MNDLVTLIKRLPSEASVYPDSALANNGRYLINGQWLTRRELLALPDSDASIGENQFTTRVRRGWSVDRARGAGRKFVTFNGKMFKL